MVRIRTCACAYRRAAAERGFAPLVYAPRPGLAPEAGLAAQRRDRALACERLQNQLESLGQEEQRLIAQHAQTLLNNLENI